MTTALVFLLVAALVSYLLERSHGPYSRLIGSNNVVDRDRDRVWYA